MAGQAGLTKYTKNSNLYFMWKIRKIFLLLLIGYRKRKMLRLASFYGMTSYEVLNESIIIDRLLNLLRKGDRK